jgi:hypothetical protein
MISDVLFDAVEEIRQYQRDIPEWYGGDLKPRIDAVIEQMKELQELLDHGPKQD